MYTYSYKSRDASGRPQSGVIQARTQSEALRMLQSEGKSVLEIRVGVRPQSSEQARRRSTGSQVKREEVIAFASQLSVMLETGVPLGDALQAFMDQTRSTHLKNVVEQVADKVVSGVSFSSAMAEYPRVFPPLMISLMEASEASGTMGMMLGRIADYLASERRTLRQIRGALTYPFIMLTFSLGVTVLLVAWVLPRFARLYESREAALPAATRIVMDISNFVTTQWPVLVAGATALVVIAMSMRMFGWGKGAVDRLKLASPVFGPIFTSFYLTRATRTLGTLLASGVGLLDAVRIVRGVTNNVLWEDLWRSLDQSITSGRTISEVVIESKLIPSSVAQMIVAGEKSGRLPMVLEKVADTTEEDLNDAIKHGTQLIEPTMIIFMGGLIGFIAIALLLPIFNVSSIMGR